ncbi:hypothetical protein RB597_006672 [Gaeumannomyces tritici]
MAAAENKTVVILGGAYAGLHVAHYVLKNHKTAKVILISKNSHFYWNMASIRAIVPGQVKEERILQPLSAALSRYPAERWELVVGSAEASDFAAKTVTVAVASTENADAVSRTLTYDQLVLATGARCAGDANAVTWKASGTYEELAATLRATADRVAAASHIVVAGGGSTGVEVAAELGFEFGKTKEIVLVTGDKQLLGGDSVAGSAAAELAKLGVKVRTEARVASVRQLEGGGEGEGAAAAGKTEVALEGAEPILTDLYLPTMGLVPNSEFVDAKHLDDRKCVVVDDFYAVKDAEGVWAAGDIVSKPRAGFMIAQKQVRGKSNPIQSSPMSTLDSSANHFPLPSFACNRLPASPRTSSPPSTARRLPSSSSCPWTSSPWPPVAAGASVGWAPSRCSPSWSGWPRAARSAWRGSRATWTEASPKGGGIAWSFSFFFFFFHFFHPEPSLCFVVLVVMGKVA